MTDYFGEPITDNSPRHAPGFGVYRGTLVQQFMGLFRPAAVASDFEAKLIDVSKWNGDNRFANCHGAFIRAGYGNGYTDPKLEANRAAATAAGIPFGLYWFAYCGYSVQSHLDGFYNAWKSNPGVLPPVVDLEWTNLTPPETTKWAGQFVSEVYKRCGVRPLVYTSPGWANANLVQNDWDYTYGLFVAHWTTASQPIIPNNWKNKGKTWTFWQHAAEGNGKAAYYGSTGGDSDMDEDRFNGSLAQFYAYAGVTPPPPPPPAQQVVTVKISAPAGVKVNVEVEEIP